MKGVLFLVCLLVVAAVAWAALYPSEGDPKNWKYVLWKHGLYAMNLDIGDGAGRDELVIGKSKAELQKQFGFLTAPAAASSYMQMCYSQSAANGQDALVIRKSPSIVIFQNDKAIDLILCKGC